MSRDLSDIVAVDVEPAGVHFRYLVFQLQVDSQSKLLVRALNFRPYRDELEQQIINWTWQGLEASGFTESGVQLSVGGGGTLNINPYYETVTLFGESPEYGAEEERETVAGLMQEAFSDHEVSWFEPGFFEEQEKIAREAKAKAAAERAARKAQRQDSERAGESSEAEPESPEGEQEEASAATSDSEPGLHSEDGSSS